jgi:hypothetical protein
MQLYHVSPSYSHRIVLALPLNQTTSPGYSPQTPSSHLPHRHRPGLPPYLPFSLSWIQTGHGQTAERGGAAASRTRTAATTRVCTAARCHHNLQDAASSCSLSHRRNHKLQPLPPHPMMTSSPLSPPPAPASSLDTLLPSSLTVPCSIAFASDQRRQVSRAGAAMD